MPDTGELPRQRDSSNDPKEPTSFEVEAADFLERFDDLEVVDLLIPDINGVLRGKQIPTGTLTKLAAGAVRLPRSAYCQDIFNQDVDEAGLAQSIGDPDGICRPVAGTLAPVPWSERPAGQVMMSIAGPDGSGDFFADPRHVLGRIVERFAARNLTPVVASELEFYLIDHETGPTGAPSPPASPVTGERSPAAQIYLMEQMSAFEGVLGEMHRACRAQGLMVETTIAEFGPGQYEINLCHVGDAVRAADQAVLMKRALRGVARRHGFDITFMAKPYGAHPGNGLHVHMSVLDGAGANIFDGPGEAGVNQTLRHAIGGLIATATDFQALFAPHANSYRRLQPGCHAPVNVGWGIDHRGAAVRVPAADGPSARFEQRIAGADANPYLVLAGVLAGALHGIEEGIDPGPPVEGEIESNGALNRHWDDAVDRFAGSEIVADYLGADYQRIFTLCKRQEIATFASAITDVEYRAYLRQV